MISYLFLTDHRTNPTPYSGGWCLNKYIASDLNSGEKDAISDSFTQPQTRATGVLPLVQKAIDHDQTLNFYFFTAYADQYRQNLAGRVLMKNPATGDYCATLWFMEHA